MPKCGWSATATIQYNIRREICEDSSQKLSDNILNTQNYKGYKNNNTYLLPHET